MTVTTANQVLEGEAGASRTGIEPAALQEDGNVYLLQPFEEFHRIPVVVTGLVRYPVAEVGYLPTDDGPVEVNNGQSRQGPGPIGLNAVLHLGLQVVTGAGSFYDVRPSQCPTEGQDAPIPRDVGIGHGGGDVGHDRDQMRWLQDRRRELGRAGVRATHHPHLSRAPFLGGEPLDCIVTVLCFVNEGNPLPLRRPAASHILEGDGESCLGVVLAVAGHPLLVVGCADQHQGIGRAAASGEVEISRQARAIAHGHHDRVAGRV